MPVYTLDDAAPYATSNGVPILFAQGWDALATASSVCMRLNQRGVYALPSHWTVRDLSELGWISTVCLPTQGCLCAAWFGRVFPYASTPTYNGTAGWTNVGCARSNDGRSLVAPGGSDVTACDVLDNGGDVLVCGRTVAFRQTAVATWVYWALCLLAVYAIRSLSYLVVRRLEPVATHPPPASEPPKLNQAAKYGGDWLSTLEWLKDQYTPDQDTRTVMACVASVVLVLIPDGGTVYVTVEENLFVWVACIYVAVYLGVWALVRNETIAHTDPPIYNLIAVTLQLTATRLYTGVETPYNPVLIWAVATRALVKLRSPWHPCIAGTIFMDAVFLSLLCVLGFGSSPCYLVGIFTVALATSDVFDP